MCNLLSKQFAQDILARSNSSVAFMIRTQNRDAVQEGGRTGGERERNREKEKYFRAQHSYR